MSKYIIWILLLSLWNVILFYGKDFGLSVIIFIIPLCLFIYKFLKNNNKINNKKGLLFLIPIILLSLCYLFFNNEVFNFLNIPVIFVLFLLMYVYTIHPTYNFNVLLNDIFSLVFSPFNYIGRLYRITTYKIHLKIKLSSKSKRIIKTSLIVIPISLIIIALLSSADMVFGSIFDNFFDKIGDLIEKIFFDNFISKIIYFVVVFFAIGCSCMYLLFDYKNTQIYSNNNKDKDQLIIKTLVTVLNIIYIIFDYIQIKSLLLHNVSSNINYAEYARNGFFELMIVSIINLVIIFISKLFENKKQNTDNNYVKIMNTIMIFLTTIIIFSSFVRMHMYELAFGYTTLRVLVFATLITESILLIPTVMYIFNSKFNIIKSYMIILLISYTIINYMNIDYMVARNNVNRYYVTNKIDLDYLKNFSYDNVSVLIELFDKTEDENIKTEIRNYLTEIDNIDKTDNIFEFNFSKYCGIKAIKTKFSMKKNYIFY